MKTTHQNTTRAGSAGRSGVRPSGKLLLLAFSVFISSLSFASHFRYGLLTATRLSETATTVTYRLNLSEAWRLGTAPVSSPFTISGGNSGSVSIPMTNVTDPSGGWTNSSGSATVTLNKSATPTRIEWVSCCKISTIINNHDRNWDVFTVINTNAGGSSPVSTLPAIINMPVGASAATYNIPASDPDPGSTLTFGIPSFTGGLAGQVEPAGFSVSASGQITFNTAGKTIGQQYNAMVTVTDNNGNLVMLDFLINMVGPSTPPEFDYGVTPLNGSVFNVIAGQNISFPIRATDSDAGSTVSLSVSGLPAYITVANFSSNALPATGNPSFTTFSWTPGGAQIGHTVVLNFIATDNVGVQTTSSVTIKVVAEPAPVFIAPTPIESSIRQIVTGSLFSDVIVAESPLGSNVSVAFATGIPSGATLSPAVPTPGAHPGQTTLDWTPAPSDFGVYALSFQATIAAIPTIFATRSYQLIVNTPPAFSSLPVTSVILGQTYSYNVTVSDPDIPYGDVVDVVGLTIPSWLTLISTGNGTATLSGTPTIGDVGLHNVSLDAEDTHHVGNPSPVEQHFTINVIEPAPVAICQDITVQLDGNGNVSITPSQVDNGSYSLVGISNMTVSPSEFHCSNVGANQVQLVVFNSYGNTDTCIATVTVKDEVAPSAACNNITVQLDAFGNASIAASDVDGGSSDACGIASIVIDNSNFTCANVGSNNVVLTVTDVHGNVSACTSVVTVEDAIAPSIVCPADISVIAQPNDCSPVITWDAVAAADNCSAVVSGSHNSGDHFNVGTTTVTYTAVDPSGNSVSCSFNVTVTPTALEGTVSAITYGGGYNVSCYGAADGSATASVSGGCLPYTYLWSPSGAAAATAAGLSAGVHSVLVTDANGTSITLSITLTEPTPVAASAGPNAAVYYGYTPHSCATLNGSASGGVGPYLYNWSTGETTASITVCPTSGAQYTLTVTDANGCVASDAVKVCVKDVHCSKGGNAIVYYSGGKVLVCHVPDGDQSKRFTICIAPDAVADHLAHGDVLGICGESAACLDGKSFNEEQESLIVGDQTNLTSYPNPFTHATIVRFNTVESGSAEVVVFNMMGVQVATLFNGTVNGMELHEEIFNAEHLPSGIYFVKLITEQGELKVERVVLNR